MKREGKRGENRWQRVSWDEAVDDIAGRIRKAIEEGRHDEVMYHVGRPGEDGYTERVLAAWDVDGHNSHTNICSSSGRAGYQWWMGYDRPSPDHANAELILLISAHLESGHYFNPHAQRVMEGKARGAKLVVFDVRLSNSATHADHWLAPWPGSEPAILLAIANHLIQERLYDREFVRRYWNWHEFMVAERPKLEPTFDSFEKVLGQIYAMYSFAFAERESGVPASVIQEVARLVAAAGPRLSTHNWRSAAAGNLGGWQVTRTLFLLNALMGAVGVPGGTFPNAWNKFVPKPIHTPPHPRRWNELSWPQEYPLAMNEMSFLLPHFLKDGRGRLDVYFSRVYNPVWTNPDGLSWIEAISDAEKVGLHVALTPTWSESAYFADYVLPVGLGSERHDLHSYETHDAQWIGFRQPVLKEARTRLGATVKDSREVNPGEVVIATAQPFVNEWVAELTHTLRKEIRTVLANPLELQRYLGEFFNLARTIKSAQKNGGGTVQNNFEQLVELGRSGRSFDANDQHIVTIVDWLWQYAFEQRASDIHMEPRRDLGVVRFRIDGVLHNVYQVPPGVLMAIVGPNGAGKTTLIKCILGLIKPVAGQVRIQGKPYKEAREAVAYVPQRGSVDWDFPTNVLDVVEMGRYGALGWLKRPRKKERDAAMQALETMSPS